jgi:thiosulfate dehydrogenase (quinone) large subunit
MNDWIVLSSRCALGWYFFHAGLMKVIDPSWSSRGFLEHAAMFPDIYILFTHPTVLPMVDVLNAWGLTLVGVALSLGIGIRCAASGGILLMVLYYFPHEAGYTYIIDDHVVIALLLGILMVQDAGKLLSVRPFVLRYVGGENSRLAWWLR